MLDHSQFVMNEFHKPIVERLRKLLDLNKIEWATESMTRLVVSVADWRARFSGLFETCKDTPNVYTPQRMSTMHKLWIKVSMQVDGIEAGCKEFEFADAVQNHGKYDEAIDGSAWDIYEFVAPILKDGFPPETKTD